MARSILNETIILRQPILSDRSIPVPIQRDGRIVDHKIKRIRILSPSDISNILASPILGLLTQQQISRIEGRKSRLEKR